MSYGEAQEEMELMWGVKRCKKTVSNTTMRHGHHSMEVEEKEVERIKASGEKPTVEPNQLVTSVDGAMVPLTTGEYREVKLMAVGEFEGELSDKRGEVKAKTDSLIYFARMSESVEFEQSALLEWHRRGGENAKRVVAVRIQL